MLEVKKATEVEVKVSNRMTLKFTRGWLIVNPEGIPMKTLDGQYECYNTKRIAQRQADHLNARGE